MEGFPRLHSAHLSGADDDRRELAELPGVADVATHFAVDHVYPNQPN